MPHAHWFCTTLLLPVALLSTVVQAQPTISGKWVFHSSVGGKTPVTVRCSLQQTGSKLSGNCTPEMANPQPSELTGEISGGAARWGYDVVFNDKPGRVDFVATTLTATSLAGTLSLSGTVAPFTAEKE